jgi:hypothetical protein
MRVKGGGGVVAHEAWFLTVIKSTGVHPLNIYKDNQSRSQRGLHKSELAHPRVAESMGKGVQPLNVSAGPSQE